MQGGDFEAENGYLNTRDITCEAHKKMTPWETEFARPKVQVGWYNRSGLETQNTN